jgi:ABC-type dipeptide/oligopeptide/nickel transport systems, permease components
MIGMTMIFAVIACAIFASFIAPHDPNKMDLANSFLPAGSEQHALGTDEFGRDLLSRLIYGARISLTVAIASILLGGTIGTVLGLAAGYYGGKIEAVTMRIMDALFAFPTVLLAISLMTVMGQGLTNLIIAISIVAVPGFARIVRGETLVIKSEEYIEVIRSLGASDARIVFRHILPNCVASVTVYATMSTAGAILSEASLSFLGLGIQPPTATWGTILRGGQEFLVVSPQIATCSGLAILITVLGFNLFGDGLRDALDPKLKR